MKQAFTFLISLLPLTALCQELRISGVTGFSTMENKAYKKLALCTGLDLGYEFKSHKAMYLLASAGILKYRLNNSDSLNRPFFDTKHFVRVQLNVRKYFFLSAKAYSFIDFGLQGSYFLKEKFEYKKPEAKTITNHGAGYNGGFGFSIGYKRAVTSTIDIDLAISGQADYLFHYKQTENQLKINNRLIGLSFYKKINR